MEKRLPFALALSILFVMLYLQTVDMPPPEGGGERSPEGTVSEPYAGPPAPYADPRAPAGVGAATTDPGSQVSVESDAPLVEETLLGTGCTSRWTSRGAALMQYELDDYHPTIHTDDPLPLLDMLDGQSPNLLLRDVGGVYGLDRVNWELEHRSEGGPLVFTREAADGLRFTRKVSATDRPFVHALSIDVTNGGSARISSLSLVLQGARGLVDMDASSRFYGRPTAMAVLKGQGEIEVVSWGDSDLSAEGRTVADGELIAAGTMTNYFTATLAPVGPTDVRQVLPFPVPDSLRLERLVDEKNPIDERDRARWRLELADDVPQAAGAELQLLVLALDPGQSTSFDFEFYAGPKTSALANQPGLSYLVPVVESTYGSMSWINRSLLWILRMFHDAVGNWGVAIILLTVLVRGLLFPINRKQQTSMTRYSVVMQKLKPQLDELKAKYKNNAKKFQEGQMKLLKEHGATPPLGGCLLMFLQFPIWISLFQILGTSIELRQASFAFWVNDLSRPDAMPLGGLAGLESLNVLPILMAAATILQMRAQPKAADAQQQQTQKIMATIMPLLMLWFLYGYSSGLSLYILTSSVLGIIEYRVIRRIWPIDGTPEAEAKAARMATT
jgi:YidC/Oxa1 family membrane protein insertase